ncbi:MAG: lactoylglutathione lyase [Candidatus Thiodiazotropha sp. (ex Notomyrtea botanica)]|nr:lactoylglutathione lyase [Candidatus Thiodiazotropha sp. (ex Notomyrtea botanica)]
MGKARVLHTMIRVGDMARSVDFYTRVLGMRILRTFDQPSDNYALTYLGYAEESEACVLELTYNYGVSTYELGNAYGHIAIGVEDCRQVCLDISAMGGEVIREAAPLEGGDEVIAFIVDPDGYQIELVERPANWF